MQTSWLASQNTSFLPLSIQLASSKVITRLYFQDITGLFYKLVHKAKLLCFCAFTSSGLVISLRDWPPRRDGGLHFSQVDSISSFLPQPAAFFFFLLRHPQWSAPLHPKHTSRSQMNGRCAVFCSNSWLWLNEACCNGKAPEVITLRKNMFYFFWIQCFRFKRLLSLKHFCAFVHFQLK